MIQTKTIPMNNYMISQKSFTKMVHCIFLAFFVAEIDVHLFYDCMYAYGEQVNQETGDFEKCDICGSPISMRRWLPPLKVKLSKPVYGDFVFGSISKFLVSECFEKKYETSRLTGIVSFEPVEIVKTGETHHR